MCLLPGRLESLVKCLIVLAILGDIGQVGTLLAWMRSLVLRNLLLVLSLDLLREVAPDSGLALILVGLPLLVLRGRLSHQDGNSLIDAITLCTKLLKAHGANNGRHDNWGVMTYLWLLLFNFFQFLFNYFTKIYFTKVVQNQHPNPYIFHSDIDALLLRGVATEQEQKVR